MQEQNSSVGTVRDFSPGDRSLEIKGSTPTPTALEYIDPEMRDSFLLGWLGKMALVTLSSQG